MKVRETEWVKQPTEWEVGGPPDMLDKALTFTVFEDTELSSDKTAHVTASLKLLGSWARFAFRKFLLRTALGSRQCPVGRGRSDLGQI